MHPSRFLTDPRFFCTVRLDGDSNRATGFLVAHPGSGSDAPDVFIATAAHAFENTTSLTVKLIAADDDGHPVLGTHHVVEMGDITHRWIAHPDASIDLAVMPFTDVIEQIDVPTAMKPIHTDRFVVGDAIAALPAIAEITFLGYPNGISDPANTTPIARRGHSATPPVLDYAGRPQFLIDASVFPGSSGSPVFSEDSVASAPDFLGVVAQAKAGPATVADADASDPNGLEMIDLGVVFKAATLLELIESVGA